MYHGRKIKTAPTMQYFPRENHFMSSSKVVSTMSAKELCGSFTPEYWNELCDLSRQRVPLAQQWD